MKNLVFILGSNGYVGSALVKKFISKNNFVIGLGRSKTSRQYKEKYVKDTNFHYFSLEHNNILSIKSQLKDYARKFNMNSIFINTAWHGYKSLSDGNLSKQIGNIYLSNDAIKLAKEIRCDKFLYIGSIFENYIDKYITSNWYENNYNFKDQLNYSLAKNICSDFNRLVSYLEKIEYIHCSFSVFIDPELSGKGYIPSTLKKISKGLEYKKPDNNELFDITLIDEGCEAIYLLSKKAKINKNYYIGTSFPRKLKDIFITFEKAKLNQPESQKLLYESSKHDLFCIKNLEKDIGYKPKTIFNKFAFEFFNK